MTVLVKPTLATTQYGVEGPSPRRQGAGWESGHAPAGRSDNPAYTGKRSTKGRACPSSADHPRMRGEERLVAASYLCGGESPPHARGGDFLTRTAKDQQTSLTPHSPTAPAMDPCRRCRALTLRPGRLPRQPVRRRPQPCGAGADSDDWRSPPRA